MQKGQKCHDKDETEGLRDGRAFGAGKKTSVTVTKKKAGFVGGHRRLGRSVMNDD